MKYTISRTSDYSGKKPCKEAKKELVPHWHLRTVSEAEFNRKFSAIEGEWRSKGKNHTTYPGGIQRQEDDREAWVVEINTLEDLQKLISKYGRLIITDENWDTRLPSIEIYDSYRE